MEKNKFIREVARTWVLKQKIKDKTKEFEFKKKFEREQREEEKRRAIMWQVDKSRKA